MKRLLWIMLAVLLASTAHAAQPDKKKTAADGQRNLAVASRMPDASEQRVALVIGNSAYTSGPLKNPANDAHDMALKLKNLGFDVIERSNITTKQIGRTLGEFQNKLTPGAIALVFYAGHGLQIKGENYLPAVDADIGAEVDVPNQSLSVRQIMDVLESAKTRLNLVFLDACRNNPYSRSFRSSEGGLAKVTAPSGTLISYATRPGSVAADGGGRNGLYTSKLLKQMDSPLQVELALKRVVSDVKEASQGRQEPWMEGSIEGDFCFAGCAQGGTQVATLVPMPVRVQSAEEIEQELWNNIKDNSQKSDYEDYLKQYPTGRFVALAKQKIKALGGASSPSVTAPSQPAISAQTNPTASTATTAGVIKDCDDCPEMVELPSGSFMMGSPGGEQGRKDNEGPIHNVNVRSFAMGKTEVTQGQWKAVMGSNPSKFSSCGNDCPVERVSWNEAQQFIEKLSQKTGKQYRLPSEAEWEYACRAGAQQSYCGSDNLDAVGWYYGNSGGKTHPVGQKQPNAWGLHDMSGNVYEWTQDCWNESYNGAPTDGKAWTQGDCGWRVVRGGSWSNEPQNARAANRDWGEMALRNYIVGFRLSRTLP